MSESNLITGISYRTAGWCAVISGVFGLLAFGALSYAVFTRTAWELTDQIKFLFKVHNGIAILQFIFLIPFVSGLYNLSQTQSPGMKTSTLYLGISTLMMTALFLILFLVPQIMSDSYYMIPQALFGAWLIVAMFNMKSVLTGGLRWSGIVIGFGLVLVGIHLVGYALFVDASSLQIPAPDFATEKDPGPTTANNIVHLILAIGSFIGVLPLPFWCMIMGRRLMREKNELRTTQISIS